MKKLTDRQQRHNDKLARKGQNRWKAPRLQTAKTAILKSIPPSFLDDLPTDEQDAIKAIVGKTVTYVGAGKKLGKKVAQLRFADSAGDTHFIFVDPSHVRALR